MLYFGSMVREADWQSNWVFLKVVWRRMLGFVTKLTLKKIDTQKKWFSCFCNFNVNVAKVLLISSSCLNLLVWDNKCVYYCIIKPNSKALFILNPLFVRIYLFVSVAYSSLSLSSHVHAYPPSLSLSLVPTYSSGLVPG